MEPLQEEQQDLLVPQDLQDHLDVQATPDKVLLGLLVQRDSPGTADQDLKETEENQDIRPAQALTTPDLQGLLDLLEFLGLLDRRDQWVLKDPEVNQETQFLTAEFRRCRDLQDHQDLPGVRDHRASKEILVFLDIHKVQFP